MFIVRGIRECKCEFLSVKGQKSRTNPLTSVWECRAPGKERSPSTFQHNYTKKHKQDICLGYVLLWPSR